MTFAGFPSRAHATAIPNVFFSDLMPKLANSPTSLFVILHAFKILQAKKGFPRFITADDLAADPSLVLSLMSMGGDLIPEVITSRNVRQCIVEGLWCGEKMAIFKPVLIDDPDGLDVDEDGNHESWLFFLNSPADRRGLAAVESRKIDLGPVLHPENAVVPDRSSVFALYESLIGTLSPLIADELAEAERLYPPEWLESAFREAAAQNARSWRYVSRILERWAIEGPDHAKTERDPAGEERYFSGKYGRILRERLDR